MNKKIMSFGISAVVLSAATMNLTSCKESQHDNPLLAESTQPFGVPDFNKIQPSDYLPAFEEAIRQNRKEIAGIAENQDSATFENTILAYEQSGKLLDRVGRIFFAFTMSSAIVLNAFERRYLYPCSCDNVTQRRMFCMSSSPN